MRVIPYRDVLWAVAYKLGLDPAVSLLKNQASALASYINAWVRRLWDSQDWPEWVVIYRYAPDTNNYLSWDSMPNDFVPIERPPLPPAPPWKIGRPLKLYLLDPRTTWAPVDTPFRLTEFGIHCGFEHGSNVWLKFMPRAPQYTSTEWDAGVTYNLNDLVYFPLTGEVYTSKINNNMGHEPDDIILANQSPLIVEELQPFSPPNPGSPEVDGVYDAVQQLIGSGGAVVNGIWRVLQTVTGIPPLPDPAANGETFTVTVFDASHITLAAASVTTTAGDSMLAIYNDLASQLLLSLPGFVSITVVTEGGSTYLRLEDDSEFTVTGTWRGVVGGTYSLNVSQTQAYNPPPPVVLVDPPVAGTVLEIRVLDAAGAVLGNASVTADGTETLATIWASWQTTLSAVPALSGFGITIDSDGHLQVQHGSVFRLASTWTSAGTTLPVVTVQQQAYQPAVAAAPRLPQILKLTIADQQVIPNATYELSFRTGDNVEHDVFYTSVPTDNAVAILSGLAAAIVAAQSTDPFFQSVSTALDTVGPSETFTIDVSYGEIGLHAFLQPVGTIFWDVIHFPLALADQVIRGAYADALKEGGQTDKGGVEEQALPQEVTVATGKFDAPDFDALSDQAKKSSRYSVS